MVHDCFVVVVQQTNKRKLFVNECTQVGGSWRSDAPYRKLLKNRAQVSIRSVAVSVPAAKCTVVDGIEPSATASPFLDVKNIEHCS